MRAAGAGRCQSTTSTSTRSRRPWPTTATSSTWPTTSSRSRGRGAVSGHGARDRQGPRRRADRRHGVQARRLHRHARDRARTDGDRVGRRHLQRAPLLGLSVLRRGRRAQRAADELPPMAPAARAARAPVRLGLRLGDHRRLPRAKMSEGATLEEAMRRSLEDLDGVFTYICVSEDALGMAKDELAAKPLVLYEGEDMVVLASEEIAIRAVIDHEIETYDPYESEVMVWTGSPARLGPAGAVRPARAGRARRDGPPDRRDRRRPGDVRRARADHATDQPRAAPARLRTWPCTR